MTMWIAVVAYFVLACTVAAALLLPAFRHGVTRRLAWVGRHLMGAQQQARRAAERNARQGFTQAEDMALSSQRWLRRHALGCTIAVALLAVPPLAVFSLRGRPTLAAFDDSVSSQTGGVVASLLQGEQLVPPPPLPPEVFVTAEVESVRPQLGSADRRWDALDAEFRQRLLLAYRLMKDEHGYEMVLIEGYRSPERQTRLASLGPQVTNAAAWQSYHQHGLAADSAFLRAGTLVISQHDVWAARGYELYGDVAQRVGLTWGGRWQNADLGHVELRKQALPRPKAGG